MYDWAAEARPMLKLLAHGLTVVFIAGVAGCVLVIPITAYRLFSILFEQDREDEQ
jgi:hypothetical protein